MVVAALVFVDELVHLVRSPCDGSTPPLRLRNYRFMTDNLASLGLVV